MKSSPYARNIFISRLSQNEIFWDSLFLEEPLIYRTIRLQALQRSASVFFLMTNHQTAKTAISAVATEQTVIATTAPAGSPPSSSLVVGGVPDSVAGARIAPHTVQVCAAVSVAGSPGV